MPEYGSSRSARAACASELRAGPHRSDDMKSMADFVTDGQFIGVFADIAQTLESPHDPLARLSRVLTLVRKLVPCDRCALYSRRAGDHPTLAVAPPLPVAERNELAAFLDGLLRFMEGERAERPIFDSAAHLALPVIGLDEMLGVLLVDRDSQDEYAPHHLRLLSAVASQLGAYLTIERLHRETAAQASLLADREQQLRGAARFREEFIGVIGHDLRSPLSAIRTGAQILSQRAALESADRGVVERVASSADRMSRMIDDLMDFARGRLGGGIPLRRSTVDLHALCREAVDEARTAHGRAVDLHLSGDPRGFWDGDRLAQLLSNLVGNALQHSPTHSAVAITVREEADHAVVAVTNGGPAIAPDHLKHIFEPFRRGAADGSAGLGLGLYIVERIVSAHGGMIEVESADEIGTTFTVKLPRRRAADRKGPGIIDRS